MTLAGTDKVNPNTRPKKITARKWENWTNWIAIKLTNLQSCRRWLKRWWFERNERALWFHQKALVNGVCHSFSVTLFPCVCLCLSLSLFFLSIFITVSMVLMDGQMNIFTHMCDVQCLFWQRTWSAPCRYLCSLQICVAPLWIAYYKVNSKPLQAFTTWRLWISDKWYQFSADFDMATK